MSSLIIKIYRGKNPGPNIISCLWNNTEMYLIDIKTLKKGKILNNFNIACSSDLKEY